MFSLIDTASQNNTYNLFKCHEYWPYIFYCPLRFTIRTTGHRVPPYVKNTSSIFHFIVLKSCVFGVIKCNLFYFYLNLFSYLCSFTYHFIFLYGDRFSASICKLANISFYNLLKIMYNRDTRLFYKYSGVEGELL